jgi:hypothetical protein
MHVVRFRGILMASICVGLIGSNPSVSTFVGENLFVGSAFAKDGGNGGGHGNGNGHSGGNEGKSENHQGVASSDDKAEKAARKEALEEAVAVADADDTDQLGALNAAHASLRARERASPKSAVGKIATYERAREKALAITDPTQQELALDAAVDQLDAAFGRTLTTAQISKVNTLLDAR